MIKVDQLLLDRYNTYGPRYTSYPTAIQFTPQFGADEYKWHINESNEDPIPNPLSLYLHIPFCHSLCYYCGCHKIITQDRTKAQGYLELLTKEITLQSSLFAKDREVKQIHFGGGTPTYLHNDEINQLLKTIESCFTLAPLSEREVGIEIDPRTTSIGDIRSLSDLGINRMSFGIQDFSPDVQKAINRIQSRQQTLELIEAAKLSHVNSISVDLIYGLPKQTLSDFRATLKTIIATRPNRIALYNYAHMPNKIKSQRLINEKDLPSTTDKLSILAMAIEELTESGYCYIGMDHFALPDDSLTKSFKKGSMQRNFQGYSTCGDCDTIGLGISAISQVGDCFSQNYKTIKDYQERVDNQQLATEKGYALSCDDKIRASIIQKIMCSQEVDINQFSHIHKIIFKKYFENELEKLKLMIEDNFLTLSEDKLIVTEIGRFFLRNIAMIFDAYLDLKNSDPKTPINFSRVL